MPTIPNISHPKLDGRKIVPWGRFTRDYHQEEERLPFFLPDRNEVWEGRLFTQKRGADKGTKKAELQYLGTMTGDTYAKFGITPPSAETPAAGNPFSWVPAQANFANRPLSPAVTGPTAPTSSTISTGTPGGTSTTGGNMPTTNTTANANTANNTGAGSTTSPQGTGWLDTVRDTVNGVVNTASEFVNSLNIPGVQLPTKPITVTAPNNGTASNTTEGATGNTGSTAPGTNAAAGAFGNTNTLLLIGAAGLGLWLLLRRK